MNFDDQIHRYFGTSNLDAVAPAAFESGIERMLVDLGLTKDRGERFALWALLHTLGRRPTSMPCSRTRTNVTPRATSWT